MADTRMIRKAIVDSECFNAPDWFAQNVFFRIMLHADDYGLFDGRIKYVRSVLFGMCLERVREADLQRALKDCERAGLIRFYSVGGKPYLHILKFGQRIQSAPKYPIPPDYELIKDGKTGCELRPKDGEPPESTVNHGEPPESTAYTESKTKSNNKTTHTQPREGAGGVQALPRSVEEVLGYMHNMPHCGLQGPEAEECARKFFDTGEECGWLTKNGLPINDWRASCRKWVQSWQLNSRYQSSANCSSKYNNYNLRIDG